MVSVMKSPNMMSTTGRKPVIAAPTPTPVNPASEIGVSTTREVPNSSTRPDKTLNGVPASATSSPMMNTRESRRISSASASRTASAKVISRTAVSGIHVLVDLLHAGIRCGDGELHGVIHFSFEFGVNGTERRSIRVIFGFEPIGKIPDRVVLAEPLLLFFFCTVIFAVYVADVMAAIVVGVAKRKCRTISTAGAVRKRGGGREHGAHILPINRFRFDSQGPRSRGEISSRRFPKKRVFR